MPDVPTMSELAAEIRAQLPPDGQRLLDVMLAGDDRVELGLPTGETDQQLLDNLIDPAGIHGVALLRATQLMVSIPPAQFLSAPMENLAAIWMDGVMAGIEFQKRGGHVE